MKRNRHGFTLVELLVVIAIIVLLASLVFPVVQKARDKSRQTSAINNLKQLTLAATMYMDSHGNGRSFPYGGNANAKTAAQEFAYLIWYYALGAQNNDLFNSPSGSWNDASFPSSPTGALSDATSLTAPYLFTSVKLKPSSDSIPAIICDKDATWGDADTGPKVVGFQDTSVKLFQTTAQVGTAGAAATGDFPATTDLELIE